MEDLEARCMRDAKTKEPLAVELVHYVFNGIDRPDSTVLWRFSTLDEIVDFLVRLERQCQHLEQDDTLELFSLIKDKREEWRLERERRLREEEERKAKKRAALAKLSKEEVELLSIHDWEV